MGKEKLKIAVFGTASLPIPPFQGYGGTQRGIYDFVKHIGGKGHQVYLFGPGDSEVSGIENVTLKSYVPKSLWVPENDLDPEIKAIESARHYRRSIEEIARIDEEVGLDIINMRSDNTEVLRELVERFGAERIVYSLHNVTNEARIGAIRELGVTCIAHCRDHAGQYTSLPNVRTIVYGIDTETYPFSENKLTESIEDPELEVLKELKDRDRDYLVNIGGVGRHKGQATSIRIARETGNALILAGMPQDRRSGDKVAYFENEVLPNVDGKDIIHFGNADEEQKKELLRLAKGFLFPSGFEDIRWNEPFGRAPVEALATGTPVVAHRKGSMPEVILHGYNGFLFTTLEEAIDQAARLDTIDRRNPRRTAETCFDSKRVAEEYEKLFYEMKAA